MNTDLIVQRIIKAKIQTIEECIERVEECTFVDGKHGAVDTLKNLKRLWEKA